MAEQPIVNEQDAAERSLLAMLRVVDVFFDSLGALKEAMKTPEGRARVEADIDEISARLTEIRADLHDWKMNQQQYPLTGESRARRLN